MIVWGANGVIYFGECAHFENLLLAYYLKYRYVLFCFFLKADSHQLYLSFVNSQVANNITGEFTMIMLKVLGEDKESRAKSWLCDLWFDFRKRMIALFGLTFRDCSCKFALSVLSNNFYKKKSEGKYILYLCYDL